MFYKVVRWTCRSRKARPLAGLAADRSRGLQWWAYGRLHQRTRASLATGKQLTYKATVKTTGISRDTIFYIEVTGLRDEGGATNQPVPPCTGHRLGGIQAWTGSSAGPCAELARGRRATGCVVVRVKGLSSV